MKLGDHKQIIPLSEELFQKKRRTINLFKHKDEGYKVELLEDIADEEVSLYEEGIHRPLQGPHQFNRTGACLKLLSVAGAYWRRKKQDAPEDLRNFLHAQKNLKQYLEFLDEVKKKGPQETWEGTRFVSTAAEYDKRFPTYGTPTAL